jgi:catechol 2,3-dioxygenase-like lactoylglutathione lyase family enzyme
MTSNPSSRRLDHLVLPAQDLDAQAAFYQRLGFQVGSRNIHPWGTENRLVQFDGAFLELITSGENALPSKREAGVFSFGAHVQNHLSTQGDGLSMLVLDSPDAKADAQWFHQAGIGSFAPFHFRRKGKRADGSETEVAFTLAFGEAAAMPDLSFFVCQQHFPENFWNEAIQQHENTASGISRVVIMHENPLECLGFIKAFAGGEPQFEKNLGFSLTTRRGILSIWSPEGARAVLGDDPLLFRAARGHFGAVIFTVDDLQSTELSLRKNNVPHRQERGRIVVPSGAAFGIMLVFEQRNFQ